MMHGEVDISKGLIYIGLMAFLSGLVVILPLLILRLKNGKKLGEFSDPRRE